MPRAFAASIQLTTGDVIVLGGEDWSTERTLTAAVTRYSMARDSWSDLAPLPSPRVRATALALADDSMLVAGGYVDDVRPTEILRYDPVADVWASVAAFSAPPESVHGTTFGERGIFLIETGTNETLLSEDSGETWQSVASLPTPGDIKGTLIETPRPSLAWLPRQSPGLVQYDLEQASWVHEPAFDSIWAFEVSGTRFDAEHAFVLAGEEAFFDDDDYELVPYELAGFLFDGTNGTYVGFADCAPSNSSFHCTPTQALGAHNGRVFVNYDGWAVFDIDAGWHWLPELDTGGWSYGPRPLPLRDGRLMVFSSAELGQPTRVLVWSPRGPWRTRTSVTTGPQGPLRLVGVEQERQQSRQVGGVRAGHRLAFFAHSRLTARLRAAAAS